MARILIVDDEEDIRLMLRDALELEEHDVELAASGSEAERMVEAKQFDVAIIDFILPGKRGLEVLQDLRRRQPFLRSIIISGQIDHDVLDTATLEKQLKDRVAADRYLSKPAHVDDIVAAIKELIEPAQSRDWQAMAAHAVRATEVKKKEIKGLQSQMGKANRKRRQ